MLVRGPLTLWLGERIEVVKEFELPGEGDLSCPNCLLTHSFINAHTHLPMAFLRGLVSEKNFWDWLREIQELEALMDDKDVEAGYYLGLWENLLAGNSTVYSMYRGYDLVRNTFGLELHIGPISFREAERDVSSLLEKFERRAPPGVVPTLFAHSLYTLPLERLREIAQILGERDIEFQIHTSETKEEVLEVKRRFGQYPVRVMEALGLITSKTMLVHAGWITKGELDIAARHGASLVHVPASNARLAIHGFFPWKEAEERGIRVLFGTDSQASNDGQSVLHDLRLALLFAKDRYWDAEPFGWRNVVGAFDRGGFALWKPNSFLTLHGKPLVNQFLYAPHLFKLRLLIKNGRLLYPRKTPPEVKKAKRRWIRFLERIGLL
ncbi:MAG: amidohydrolase family protein [Candidatus Diapherotrites archaeon]|nr:amidohydrolase family protein [Candidatus Diapherotrites archaeon]